MSYYAFHDHNFCQSIEFSDQSTFIACHNMFKVKLCRRNIKLSPKHILHEFHLISKKDLLWFVASCHHNHFKRRRKKYVQPIMHIAFWWPPARMLDVNTGNGQVNNRSLVQSFSEIFLLLYDIGCQSTAFYRRWIANCNHANICFNHYELS